MTQPKKMPTRLRSLVEQLVNIQAVIGLVMIFGAVATLWRPAGAVLVVGALLALGDIMSALRGRSE